MLFVCFALGIVLGIVYGKTKNPIWFFIGLVLVTLSILS